jgi:hypothetical protein
MSNVQYFFATLTASSSRFLAGKLPARVAAFHDTKREQTGVRLVDSETPFVMVQDPVFEDKVEATKAQILRRPQDNVKLFNNGDGTFTVKASATFFENSVDGNNVARRLGLEVAQKLLNSDLFTMKVGGNGQGLVELEVSVTAVDPHERESIRGQEPAQVTDSLKIEEACGSCDGKGVCTTDHVDDFSACLTCGGSGKFTYGVELLECKNCNASRVPNCSKCCQ